MTKAELLTENDELIALLEDIDETVKLPRDLQDRVDAFLSTEDDEDDEDVA